MRMHAKCCVNYTLKVRSRTIDEITVDNIATQGHFRSHGYCVEFTRLALAGRARRSRRGLFPRLRDLTKAFGGEDGSFSLAQDLSLIALAAWLHHKSEQAKAAAESDGDEYGARTTLETTARLAQASHVIKEVADRPTREVKAVPRPREMAAAVIT